MGRFDRYLLSQLMVLFGFFALVLVLVYWINSAVQLFDRLVSSGEPTYVFFEFTALILPNAIRLMLPVSAFAAVVYVISRLNSESELVVVRATGFSPWRLARPVLAFGAVVATIMLALTHYLVPASLQQLAVRQAEVAENVTSRLLTEGTFLHPSDGVTFYIREITPEGELRNLFISDARSDNQRTTYMAERALLVRDEAGPTLLMFDGMAQTYRSETRQLAVTEFRDFAYNIASLVPVPAAKRRNISRVPTPQLFAGGEALEEETGATYGEMIYLAHHRFAQALSCLTAPLFGYGILMIGGFSRFGGWRQIVIAILGLTLLEVVDKSLAGPVREDPSLWALTYAGPLLGLTVGMVLIQAAAHPGLFRWRRRAGGGANEAPA